MLHYCADNFCTNLIAVYYCSLIAIMMYNALFLAVHMVVLYISIQMKDSLQRQHYRVQRKFFFIELYRFSDAISILFDLRC